MPVVGPRTGASPCAQGRPGASPGSPSPGALGLGTLGGQKSANLGHPVLGRHGEGRGRKEKELDADVINNHKK